jgi:hypothetical protein
VIAALAHAKVDGRRTENMTRLQKVECEVLAQIEDPPVGNSHHEILHRDCVWQRVQRLAFDPDFAPVAEELVVLFLNVGRIGQHHRVQVAGGGGGVDRAVKTLLDQERKPPAMVDVGMTEHDRVDPAGVERQLHIQRMRFRSPALEESGIEQYPGSRGLEQMHGTGDLAGRAPKRQSNSGHERTSPKA